jgi:hypothetical protein
MSRIALASLLLAGCSFHVDSPAMRPAEGVQSLKAGDGQALVVFVRPSAYAFAIGGNILDENGKFLGDSLAQSYFAVPMAPGHHLFTVWAENTDAISADLAAGRVYYVEVAPTMGAFSAQIHLRAIKPGQPSWPQLSGWMAKSRPLISDVALGQSRLDARANDVAERLRRAGEHIARYRGEELLKHTLGPDDGISG